MTDITVLTHPETDQELADLLAGPGVHKVAHDIRHAPLHDEQIGLGTLDEAPSWLQENSAFNAIANMQGIEPGSWPWLLGGPAAFSGSSGSQASYGWNHKSKVAPDYVKAVVANYGHRRVYYTNAPNRAFDYYAGGRPLGWRPELPGDNPDGTCTYVTSRGTCTVSGPEAEHFWLDPLWALVASPPVTVQTPYGKMTSGALAGVMARMQLRNIMGAIRDPKTGKPYPWGYGDRANSRILDTFLQAAKWGALELADAQTGYEFIVQILLPHYEAAPGIGEFLDEAYRPTQFAMGTFNSLYWLLPVFADAVRILPNPLLRARFQAIVDRWSQWALDLEQCVPGRGFDMAKVFLPRIPFTAGENGKPLNTIAPLLNANNIVFNLGWETWSFRACATAAKVTGSPVLKLAQNKLVQKHGADPKNKVWLVGTDREYVPLTPVE